MSAQTLPPSLTSLAGIAGRVVTPDDPSYDKTRTVFYGGIDKRPSAIVRVTNVDDVRRAIAAARTEGLELAVRSGGHSIVGHSTTDGGLVIDLREMSKIDIDPDARTAWVETGATAHQVTEGLSQYGLVIGFLQQRPRPSKGLERSARTSSPIGEWHSRACRRSAYDRCLPRSRR